MSKALIIPILLFASISSFSQRDTDHITIENFLNQVEGLTYEILGAGAPGTYNYEILYEQPLDHINKEAGTFTQKIILEHRSFDIPTIMHTNGYTLNAGPRELLEIIEANYLNVEHRFFGESKPDSLQWQYLNFEQITADLHRVFEVFDQLYLQKWISSGVSKGGSTAMYYEYFYPKDMDVTIPYVAPVNFSDEDERIYDFLAIVGSLECRKKLQNFQFYLLKNRDEIVGKLFWYGKGQGSTFDYLNDDMDLIFEYTVLEYPFSFWQLGYECANVPLESDNIDAHIAHLLEVVDINFYNDASMDFFAPLYYQGATEMGYYGFETEIFKDYLRRLKDTPSAAFVPKGVDVRYDNTLNEHIHKWLQGGASNILFIYGEYDTWTATAADIGMNNRVKKYVVPKEDHRDARISNMDTNMKIDFTTTLYKWLKE